MNLAACTGFACLSAAAADAVAATPQDVSIPAKGTFLFTASTPVTWSLAPGSVGTIAPTGLYTGPAAFVPQQSAAGVQLLPNDHIYNTPITNLPVDANNEAWMAVFSTAPYHGAHVTPVPAFEPNVVATTTPATAMTFLFTPQNNGSYPFWAWPGEWVQNGALTSYLLEGDRHILSVNVDTGVFSEVYNTHPLGTDSRNTATNAVSGVQYALNYNLNGGTVAAGMYLQPLLTRAAEVRSGHVNHAAAFTLPNGAIAGNAHCPCFIWPATNRAYAGGGEIPYGARFRLKASVDISMFSPYAQVILNQWKEYGMFLTDGGIAGQVEMGNDLVEDQEVRAAVDEISSNGKYLGFSNFEIVDEASLMIAATSGQVNPANPYVRPAGYATVIATDKANPAIKTTYHVALQAVTVGVPRSSLSIQAGVATQLTSWVSGTTNKAVRWSMSPALGTLTAAGLYTAPAVTTPTVTTLTATSVAEPAASTTVKVTVFPAGGLYMRVGTPSSVQPYTDSAGHVWHNEFMGDIGYTEAFNYTELPCCTEWTAPRPLDDAIWYFRRFNWGGDMIYRFNMPNGSYRITLYEGQGGQGAMQPHSTEFAIESQGKIIDPDFDLATAGGGHLGTPVKYSFTVNVTNGTLYFALRSLLHPQLSLTALPHVGLNAVSIVPE